MAPVQKDYTLPVEHDGQSYEVTVRDVQVSTCPHCGEAIVTSDVGERVSAEVHRVAGLLAPEAIHDRREALGLTQSQWAAALLIPEATLARWETGMQFQQHSLDLLLRLYFASGEVRRACPTPAGATLGTTVLSAGIP